MVTKEQILSQAKDIDKPYSFTTGPKTRDYIQCSFKEYVEKYPIGVVLYYGWFYFDDDYNCTYPNYCSRSQSRLEEFKERIKQEFAGDFVKPKKARKPKDKDIKLSSVRAWLEEYFANDDPNILDNLLVEFDKNFK